MKNWLFEGLTFKIWQTWRKKKEIHGKFGKYLCRMSDGIS
jgi:hypothetical protein